VRHHSLREENEEKQKKFARESYRIARTSAGRNVFGRLLEMLGHLGRTARKFIFLQQKSTGKQMIAPGASLKCRWFLADYLVEKKEQAP
jgi:hypothetical protein